MWRFMLFLTGWLSDGEHCLQPLAWQTESILLLQVELIYWGKMYTTPRSVRFHFNAQNYSLMFAMSRLQTTKPLREIGLIPLPLFIIKWVYIFLFTSGATFSQHAKGHLFRHLESLQSNINEVIMGIGSWTTCTQTKHQHTNTHPDQYFESWIQQCAAIFTYSLQCKTLMLQSPCFHPHGCNAGGTGMMYQFLSICRDASARDEWSSRDDSARFHLVNMPRRGQL